jgi:hypothetical protein
MSSTQYLSAATRNLQAQQHRIIAGRKLLCTRHHYLLNQQNVAAIKRSVATQSVRRSSPVVVQAVNMPLNDRNVGGRRRSNKKTSSNQRLSMAAVAAAPPIDTTASLSCAPSTDSELKIPVNLDDVPVDMAELERLASLKPTPLRLSDMYKYGGGSGDKEHLAQRLRNAQFLHRELPIRIAQRAFDLLSLPHGLSTESTPIRHVALTYVYYLHQLKAMPVPTTLEQEDAFTHFLHGMVLDRTSIPSAIAKGLVEWFHHDNRREDLEVARQQEMEDALVRFFTARVGLRFLTEHHILSSPNQALAESLRQSQSNITSSSSSSSKTSSKSNPADLFASDNKNSNDEVRGCIQKDCDPVLEAQKVAEEVSRQTYDCYGCCPEIEIVDRQSSDAKPFTYVPLHLHYMLAELLKNSCRASILR